MNVVDKHFAQNTCENESIRFWIVDDSYWVQSVQMGHWLATENSVMVNKITFDAFVFIVMLTSSKNMNHRYANRFGTFMTLKPLWNFLVKRLLFFFHANTELKKI
jgi:hypothetical protein